MSIEIQRYQEDWTLQEFLNANLAEEKRVYQTMLQNGILPGDEFLFPKNVDRIAFLKGKLAMVQQLFTLMEWYVGRKQIEAEESQYASERDEDETWEEIWD
jgi:hypothetical protein